MPSFTCHITRRDEVVRRVQIMASTIAEARAAALAGHPGRVSCRANDAPRFSRDALPARRRGDLQ